MKYKIGQHLYHLYVNDEGNCEMETWEVVALKRPRCSRWLVRLGNEIPLKDRPKQYVAYARNKWTWIKKSNKHHDWGWKPRMDDCWRQTWKEGTKASDSWHPLHTTKRAAWVEAGKSLAVEDFDFGDLTADNDDTPQVIYDRAMATIKRMIKRA